MYCCGTHENRGKVKDGFEKQNNIAQTPQSYATQPTIISFPTPTR